MLAHKDADVEQSILFRADQFLTGNQEYPVITLVTDSERCHATALADFHGYIVPPAGTNKLGQSELGRAHDLLWILYVSIRRSKSARQDQLLFQVIFLMAPAKQETVTHKSMCGPGDNGEPVLTVMLPEED